MYNEYFIDTVLLSAAVKLIYANFITTGNNMYPLTNILYYTTIVNTSITTTTLIMSTVALYTGIYKKKVNNKI